MSAANQIYFQFGNGPRLTAQELGYLSFKSAAPSADADIKEFAEGGLATQFPQATSITQAPFLAHLYLSGFYSGCYLSYAVSVLGMPENGIQGFLIGLRDAITSLTPAAGRSIHNNAVRNLLEFISNVAAARDVDMDEDLRRDPKVYNPRHAHATAMTLAAITAAYTRTAIDLPRAERITPETLGIGAVLDQAPTALLTALQQQGLRLSGTH
jgi:hypothetical protein